MNSKLPKLPNQPKSQILFYKKGSTKDFIRRHFGKIVFLAKGVSRKSVFLYTHSDREDMSHNSVESEIRRRPVPEKADWDSLFLILAEYL